jgi:hypothetical protein
MHTDKHRWKKEECNIKGKLTHGGGKPPFLTCEIKKLGTPPFNFIYLKGREGRLTPAPSIYFKLASFCALV